MTAMATVTFITFAPADGTNGNGETCDFFPHRRRVRGKGKDAIATVNFVNFWAGLSPLRRQESGGLLFGLPRQEIGHVAQLDIPVDERRADAAHEDEGDAAAALAFLSWAMCATRAPRRRRSRHRRGGSAGRPRRDGPRRSESPAGQRLRSAEKRKASAMPSAPPRRGATGRSRSRPRAHGEGMAEIEPAPFGLWSRARPRRRWPPWR